MSKLSSKTALYIFIFLVCFAVAMATWWVILMAKLVSQTVDVATLLGASQEFINQLEEERIARQIMLGMEGTVFLMSVLLGVWLIYRSLVKAEQFTHRQQNFLMSVTHELKTPLASIKLYLESIESEKIPAEKKTAIIPRMKQDVYRLECLIGYIIDAARFEKHDYKIKHETINLSQLIDNIIDSFEQAATTIPLSVKSDIKPDLHIRGDTIALSRAIGAILENMNKYHDGHKIEVAVHMREAGDKNIVLSLADAGIGLEKSDLKKIFERFYRVGNELTRSTAGTGLGLYLCYEIIKMHGGEINAKSDGSGKGAEFVITLPCEVI